MTLIQNPNVALRGWQLVPWAYYIRGEEEARRLTQEEFDILSKCDGKTDISPSPVLESLIDKGLCAPIGEPAGANAALTEWQRFRYCDNRYFPSVNWAVTGRCNFNCLHCFNAADNAPLMSEFTWEQCQSFISQLYDCGIQNVTLTGGEPMMHPQFMRICKEVDKLGMVVNELTSNGCFITPEMLDEFDNFNVKPLFKLSLDGLGHHDWFRDKKGSEQEVLEKVKLLVSRGYRTRIQTNVHRGNMDTILPTVKLAEGMGVESIRIIRTTEAPRWAEKGGDLCLSVKEYYDFALSFVRDFLAEGLKISVDIWQVFQIWPRRMEYHHRPMEGIAEKYRSSIPVCRGARGRVAVTPEGDVVPCNQMSGYFKKHGIHLGNVHETPLKELLSDSRYLDYVCMTINDILNENPKCQKCKHWKTCMGGCRAIGLLFGGTYKHHDPAKCVYFEHYMDRFAALFGDGWRCIDR